MRWMFSGGRISWCLYLYILHWQAFMELGDIMRNGQDWFTNLQTVSQSEEPRHAPQDLAMHDVTESHLNQTTKSRPL
jgi:hypothetical protein